MPYRHITKEERIKIEAWHKIGHTPADMARWLGRNRSSIGCELERARPLLGGLPYQAKIAEERRREVRAEANQARRRLVANAPLAQWVERKLRKRWSPEQISGRLEEYPPSVLRDKAVCHETIYQYVYHRQPALRLFLRRGQKRYRRNRGTMAKNQARIAHRLRSIEERPVIVEKRSRLGDWEGDTIVGQVKTDRIVTHAERKSGKLLADRTTSATAAVVLQATERRFLTVAQSKRHTITYDRGVEFAEHPSLEAQFGCKIYFTHPYRSWERGTNENTNGLIRQYYPKGSSFREITQRQPQRVVNEINGRPRKRLNWKTPDEVFYGRSPCVAV